MQDGTEAGVGVSASSLQSVTISKGHFSAPFVTKNLSNNPETSPFPQITFGSKTITYSGFMGF